MAEPEAKTISFTGQFSGKNQVGSSASNFEKCSGDLISLNLPGAGQFTQIGAATVELVHCGRPEPVSSNPLIFEVLYGKIVPAGANDDEIHLDYEGNVVHSARITLNGKFSITGGTGRFSGAQGNGTFVCEMTGPDNESIADL
ncbi:hypothetical protein HUU40_24620 [candidate division KSB1 bacterium]|nr:hypothetical protein [candidate division KSB1 bacterium]